jgi:hypothetical protein
METHLKIYKINERISETVHFEAYFDLWGFSVGWINAICDALHEYTEPSQGDEGEAYRCEACMGFRFISTSYTRTQEARKIFNRLANLATAEQRKHVNRIGYKLVCG